LRTACRPPRFVFRRTEENRNSLAAVRAALGTLEGEGLLTTEVAAAPPPDLEPGDVLAYSFTTVELDAVAEEIAPVAGSARRPLLIAGGSHPSADPQGVVALGFDAAFVGEAERTLPELAAAWCFGPDRLRVARDPIIADHGPPFEIDGVPHATGDTEEFPFVEIARGCPHACAFCQVPSLHGRRQRFRSPATVAAGVAHAVARGHRRFRFLAPDAFAYRDGDAGPAAAVAALVGACRAAGAGAVTLGTFPSEVRPDHVRTDLLEVVARDCVNRTIVVGAQSGSDEVLRLMRRGHTVEESRRAIRLIGEAGLVPHVDLLFGFPGETRADRLLTVELGREVLASPAGRIHVHAYLPLCGTPAWPAAPEPMEPEIAEAIRGLERTGRADGYWERQREQGRRVLEQAREGLISTSSGTACSGSTLLSSRP
jgi:B12-binding domain/radical SAM domain protein